MRAFLATFFALSFGLCAAQDCPGTIEYMTDYGPCGKVVVPRFVVRAAIEGTDSSWYGVAGTAKDTVWAKVSWGWIEHLNDDSCARERFVKYRPCDPTKPDTLRFVNVVNSNRNHVETVDWRRVVGLRFTDLRLTNLPPSYERIVYPVGDNTGVRFMPDGRWKMSNGTYCTQTPPPATWMQSGVIPLATITFPAPIDISHFLGKTSSGAALRFEAATMEVLAMP